jgi:hypothetical protein
MLLSAAPVTIRYGYDNTISLDSNIVYTFDNLDFTVSNLLVSARDVAINNDQLSVLTRNIYLPKTIEQPSVPATKDYIYSTLITNNDGAYLYATNSTSVTGSTLSFTGNVQLATVFNFYFPPASSNNLQIFYTVPNGSSNVNLYLTCNPSVPIVSAGINSALLESDYTFFYLLSGNSLSLITISPAAFGTFIGNNGSSLNYTTVTPTGPNSIAIPATCIFRALRFTNDNQYGTIEKYGQSDLVKYFKKNNSLSIEESSGPTSFNYLFTAPYKTISASNIDGVNLDINLMPVKNYYDPRMNQIVVKSNEIRLRRYNKIFTGLNQEDGYDKMYLGYTSRVTKYTFNKDEDNYFHIPYGVGDFPPYSTGTLPLSDTDIIDYGAYSNTTPYRSDRIFKKNADYKNYSNWGDSNGSYYPLTGTGTILHNGTYLCTWLSAGPIGVDPIWVDRFFDPRYVNLRSTDWTTISALSSFLSYSSNNYPNVIWDTPSNLTFEPGVLYYYHRIGDGDNNTLVQSFSGLTYHFNSWGPILYNQVTGLSAGLITSFTSANSGINTTVRTPYYIPGDTYGVVYTNNIDFTNNKGNTLSFFSYQDDWSQLHGDQIVGNYFNGGIGIFNNIGINTPYFTVGSITDATTTSAATIRTFNDNLTLLNYETYTTFLTALNDPLSASNFILRSTYDESYYIIDGHSNEKYLSTFDPDDLIISKISLTDFAPTLQNEYVLDATLYPDVVTGEKHLIVKTRPTSTSVTYRRFLTNGILLSSTTSTAYNNFAVDLSGNPVYFNSKTLPVSALSGSNCCVDSTGLVFALSGNNTTDVLTRNGTSILTVTKPEYIQCDQEDNIWITYNDTSLAKVTRDGRVLWTKQINVNETITNYAGVRTINFIADIANGVNYYALILDPKTNYIYKINGDGNTIGKQFVSNLVPFGDITGFDYQRKYIRPYVPGPSIKLKIVSTDSTLVVPTPQYYSLTYSVSGLAPGWHHFGATYDETNVVKFYVDGELVREVSSRVRPGYNVTGNFLHRIFNFKNNPQLLLGTSSFKTGTLATWTEQPVKFNYNGEIADVRFYSITLTSSDIKAISKNYLYNQFNNLSWIINVGTRDYIEEIERFFIHRLPGSKSQFYDIKVKNSGIEDPKVKTIVENNLRAAAAKVAPAYTRLRSIIWE